ncbi:MAG: CheR family methyltransferase [Pseudobdellovibrionaceae bacterium]
MKTSNNSIMAIASEISQVSGVQLGERQKEMVVQRLRRRMTMLGLADELEYVKYYLENRQEEFPELLSLFTTHHTFFFREFRHFELLKSEILQKAVAKVRQRRETTLRVWSAACSRGQEVYSLAIFVEQYLRENAPEIKFEIYGSDIDSISVEIAKNSVFSKKEIDSVPLIFQEGNFIPGAGQFSEYVKIHSRFRDVCHFSSANLLDAKTWPDKKFDIIFCRNVFIYFSPQDIKKTSDAFAKALVPAGHLFLGLTETLNGLDVTFKVAGPSIYQMPDRSPSPELKVVPSVKEIEKKYRVLCVDDSPTILTLLRQMFASEKDFVIETASNGAEALEKIKGKKYDFMTLDIHMPIMTGLDFMKKSNPANRPPVLVVSSVEREDQSLAFEMLRLGAKDYVQKPTLKDFESRKEEILVKAKLLTSAKPTSATNHSLDNQFKKEMSRTVVRGTVALIFNSGDFNNANEFIKQVGKNQIQHKMFPVRAQNGLGPFLPKEDLASCDAIVVLSSFSKEDLMKLKESKIPLFLLEECYRGDRLKLIRDFEIYPTASINYIVLKYLREKNGK